MEENNNNEKTILDKGKQAVKDEAKKVGKSVRNKVIIWAWPVISTFLLIILAIGLLNVVTFLSYSLFTSITDTSVTANVSGSIVSIESDGQYQIPDNISGQILEELENQSVDVEAMGFLIDEDMIDKYVKAELQTMYPKIGSDSNGLFSKNDFDGSIIIKRASTSGKETTLQYKKYDDLKEMVENGDDEALIYFSLNPKTFDLCIPAYEGTSTEYKNQDGKTIKTEGSMTLTLKEMPYQTAIQAYAMPFNFLVSLHIMTQDSDFMNDVVKMGIGEEGAIELTYVESSVELTETKDYSGEDSLTTEVQENETEDLVIKKGNSKFESIYLEDEEKEEVVDTESEEIPESKNITINNDNISDYSEYVTVDYFEKVTTTSTGVLQVTKADTWLKSSSKEIGQVKDTGPIKVGEDVNVIKDEYNQYSISINDKEEYLVTEKLYIEEKVLTTTESKSYTVVDGDSAIKVDGFVELIKEYPKVENNLVTAPSQMFYLLQQNENTQKLEQVMRYVIYKLSGIDYGVSEEDLANLFSDSYVKFSAANNLSTYLRQFVNLYEAEKTSDGNYYVMSVDSNGIPIIGNADLQWNTYQSEFAQQGKVLENEEEKEVENVQEYVNSKLEKGASGTYSYEEIKGYNICIEVDLVDDIGDETQEVYYNAVKAATSSLELSRQQLWALTAIYLNTSANISEFVNVYEAGVGLHEINSWEHNKYIWENWWSKLAITQAEKSIVDAAFETYIKGIYDFSKSDAGEPLNRTKYIYYNYSSSGQNEEEIFTYQKAGGISGTVTVNGYEFQTYTSSNGKTYTWYYQNSGTWANELSSGGSTMSEAGCCRTSVSIIGSGYGDTGTPNWGRGLNDLDREERYIKACTDDPRGGADLTSAQIKEIQEWLYDGGEVIIHVIGANRGGYSSYTSNQHWMPLVDISDDGRQVYIMNTVSNYADKSRYGWNDITKVGKSVNCYHLVKGLN